MRRLTQLGIALVIIAVILTYTSSAQFESNISNNTLQSIIIMPHNSFVAPVHITNETILGAFYYSNSSNLTYYFMNSQAFASISPYLNSTSLFNESNLYKGNGLYEIIYHNNSGTFPAQFTSAPRYPNYLYNGTPIFNNGTYYDILQNTGNKSTLAYYSIIQKIQVSVGNSILASTVYGLFAAMLLLVGIGMIGYSLFSKGEAAPKDANANKDKNISVDELYAKYGNKTVPKSIKKHRKS